MITALAALALAPVASAADNWLPHPADATWTYQWTDTTYSDAPTTEKVTVKSSKGAAFTLAWTTDGVDNPDGAVSTAGTVAFQESNNGIVNTDWSSTPPPSGWPVLCASASSCGNALSSTYYNVIWGSRNPVLQEPLVQGLTWSSTGGAGNDVASTSSYLGQAPVTVPAFPQPVQAARVRTTISQAGALGDPYGSGTRTIWWVYGVGPVKPEVQQVKVDAVVNGSARFTVKDVSGPIKVAGSYGFSKRLDGVTNLWGNTQSATQLKFPPLGPSFAAPANRRHLVTPLDLLTFGFNPVLPAYPAAGDTWSAEQPSRDYTTYGVTGGAKVLGVQTVKVPAGTFHALAVVSTLTENKFPYGSGTREAWFAPGKGLVKLVWKHADGSVSTVELLK